MTGRKGALNPNLQIRRSGRIIQDRLSLAGRWADIPDLSPRVSRWLVAWQQCWLQSRLRSDLRITSVFWCVARKFKACVSLRFSGCGWRRSLAVDGSSGTSRGHASGLSMEEHRWSRRSRASSWRSSSSVLARTRTPSLGVHPLAVGHPPGSLLGLSWPMARG